MEWVVYLLLGSAFLYTCAFIVRLRKKRDERILQEEIDRDFIEEFECDEDGTLTDDGMENMLDWLDEQDAANRMDGLEELDESSPSQTS